MKNSRLILGAILLVASISGVARAEDGQTQEKEKSDYSEGYLNQLESVMTNKGQDDSEAQAMSLEHDKYLAFIRRHDRAGGYL